MDESRLSLSSCRTLLGASQITLTDDQLEVARDQLYEFVKIVFDPFDQLSRLDLTSLNPPGVEEFFREMGWDMDGPEDEDWLGEDGDAEKG
ncbi:MAG: hypothetical protein JST11_07910 [Acidobacteria bacterium]|nr:hypothetical protein [Acidobacteriota bacterium]